MKIIITSQEIIKALNLPEGSEIELQASNQEPQQQDFWTITDPHNVKTSELIKKARKMFKNVYIYDEKNIDKQFPAPKNDIVVSFRKSYEPDKEHLGKSYNQFMAEKDKLWMTFRQYFILAMHVWATEGRHLDENGWTRTSSLWADGCLMVGNWDGTKARLYAGDGSAGNTNPDDGPREQFYL